MKEQIKTYGSATKSLLRIQVGKLYLEIGWVVEVYRSLTELAGGIKKQLDSTQSQLSNSGEKKN